MASNAPSEELDMILVMGITGAGKSYFVNKLAGKEIVQVGNDLNSCTSQCSAVPTKIGAHQVLLIDTPGFDDTLKSDSEILSEISRLLAFQYEAGVKLKGIFYLHRITDTRFGGSSGKFLKIFTKMCGQNALKNVMLVTTRWGEVQDHVGADRERQLRTEFWSYMLDSGSTLARFHGSHDSAVGLASQLLSKDDTILELQHELVDQGKPLNQTAAGVFVGDRLEDIRREHEETLEALRSTRLTLQKSNEERRRKTQVEKEEAAVRKTLEDEERLRQQIAAEVRAEVEAEKRKHGGLRKALPFIPAIMSTIGLFVGIPPGTFELISSWFSSLGVGEIFSNIFEA